MTQAHHTITKSGLLLCLAAMVAAIVMFIVVDSVSAPPQSMLSTAVAHYKSADYDQAIDMLTAIVDSNSASVEDKKEALRYLGRSYVAKRLTDKAKQSIQELLTLEPPIVEFDPDRESPPMMKVYYEARKSHSGDSYQVERSDPGLKTMAVIDFQNNSITDREKYAPMEKGFPDIMINRLNGATDLKVIERERLQWILTELEIQNQYNMEGAVRAGKQLGVHAVLLGSYIVVNKEIWISARLVKVETSEILLTEEVKGKVDKFFDLVANLSNQVSGAIDSKIELSSAEEKSNSKSLEAMLAYSEGLSLIEKSDYPGAHQKFLYAAQLDPGYERAKLKAESIEPLLDSYAMN